MDHGSGISTEKKSPNVEFCWLTFRLKRTRLSNAKGSGTLYAMIAPPGPKASFFTKDERDTTRGGSRSSSGSVLAYTTAAPPLRGLNNESSSSLVFLMNLHLSILAAPSMISRAEPGGGGNGRDVGYRHEYTHAHTISWDQIRCHPRGTGNG